MDTQTLSINPKIMASKTVTMTMDENDHRMGKIIAADLGHNFSSLTAFLIKKYWKDHYTEYKNFSLEKKDKGKG